MCHFDRKDGRATSRHGRKALVWRWRHVVFERCAMAGVSSASGVNGDGGMA
jgi:hypothetical protein